MRRLTSAILGLCLALLGCTPSTEERVALAKLSQTCAVNSDCAEPLVCAFGSCHSECGSSRDCDPGLRCVKSDLGVPVCQLPSEVSCGGPNECPGAQLCGVDAECRDGCRSPRDCVSGQTCVVGTCADPEELSEDGVLPPSEERTPDALPCALNSDCPGTEVCREGSCALACQTSVDCPVGRHCEDGRCALPASGCVFSNECDDDERCESGRCVPLPAPVECEYDSDCDDRESKCEAGTCTCECSTTADCPRTFVCADACTCVAGRIVDGFLQVENLRQLEQLLDVAEFRGVLILAIPLVGGDPVRLRLPHLRRVDALYVTGSSIGELELDSLETVPGEFHVAAQNLTTLRTPRLTTVGQLHLSGALKLASADFSALRSATMLGVYNLHPALDSLTFPRLEKISGALHVSSTGPTLGTLAFAELLSVGNIDLQWSPGLTTFSAPKLERVESSLTAGATGLSELSFPALGTLGESVYLNENPHLERVELPTLVSVSILDVNKNPALRSLELPSLTEGLTIVLSSNGQLGSVSFPACENIGNTLMVSANVSLESVSFPVLGEARAVTLIQNEALETASFPLLASVEEFSLTDAVPLTAFDLASLTTASLSLTLIGNAALSNLDSLDRSKAGSLATVGHVTIQSNASLPGCLVNDLQTNLDAYASFNASGNGGVCP